MACAIAPVPCPMHFPARNLMTFVNWTEWLDAPRGDFCMGKPPSPVHKRHEITNILFPVQFPVRYPVYYRIPLSFNFLAAAQGNA